MCDANCRWSCGRFLNSLSGRLRNGIERLYMAIRTHRASYPVIAVVNCREEPCFDQQARSLEQPERYPSADSATIAEVPTDLPWFDRL